MNDALKTVQAYTDAGLCIIPIKTDGSKAPAAPTWKQYQQAAPPADTVRQWWGNGHAPGIGVVWGKVSGNGEALDFDAPGLYEQYAVLCAEHGLADVVQSCPLVETPSGGRHLLYRCQDPVQGNQKLAQRLDKESGAVETLIETRGEGGYTLAPGSPASCHPDNKPYKFLRGRPNTLPTITGEQRSLLLALAASFNEYVKPSAVRDAPKARTEGTGTGLKPGEDYNQRGDYESLLERRGWRRLRSAGGKDLWQRPGKSGIGVSATSNYGGNGLFHVFSSNATPFDAGTAYSPFAVYALLEHGGDFIAAASELGGQGYGEPLQQRPRLNAGERSDTGADGVLSSHYTPPAQEWPTLAAEARHGVMGEIVRAIEPHTEADPAALLVHLLVFFGSCIGRGAYCLRDGARHYTNEYAVIVGATSSGKKGTAAAQARAVFAAVAPEWETTRFDYGLTSGEGLIHNVRDAREGQVKDKKTRDMETVTIDEGVEDKRLLVMESEFASVLRRAKAETSTLSTTVRLAWDSGNLSTMTKKDPNRATGAHVSIIGHITPGELTKDLSHTESINGFGNRFLWALSRKSKELPHGGDAHALSAALAPLLPRLEDAIDHAQKQGEMTLDADARRMWEDVYHDLTTDKPGMFGSMVSRAAPHTIRLALLYALLDGDTAIRAPHLLAALSLWAYCEASARYIFGDALGDAVADALLLALRETEGGMTRTEINALFQKHQTAARIGQALALLAKGGHVRTEKQSTEGRPTERFFAM